MYIYHGLLGAIRTVMRVYIGTVMVELLGFTSRPIRLAACLHRECVQNTPSSG